MIQWIFNMIIDKLPNECDINGISKKIRNFSEWRAINNILERESISFKRVGNEFNLFIIPELLFNGQASRGKAYNSIYLDVHLYNWAEQSSSLRLLKTYSVLLKEYLGDYLVRNKELSEALSRILERITKDFKSKRIYEVIYGRDNN